MVAGLQELDAARSVRAPLSTTLIHSSEDAVLVEAPLLTDQAKAVGDWVECTASG